MAIPCFSFLNSDQAYKLDDIIYINIGFTLDDTEEFRQMKVKMQKRREAKKIEKAARKREFQGEIGVEVEQVRGFLRYYCIVNFVSINNYFRKKQKRKRGALLSHIELKLEL